MPAKKKDVRSLIRKRMGKEAGDALLQEIDGMLHQRAPASDIKKTIRKHLSKHMNEMRTILEDFEPPESRRKGGK
jgi:signal transduction histidine kinase